MEKLSSILPASPRVKSVDLSEAKPRRPGAPTFGVPEGSTSSARDRVSISSQQDAVKDTLTYKNPKDARGAKIAGDIAKKFFETRLIKQEEAPVARSEAMTDELADLQAEVIPSHKFVVPTPEGSSDNSIE